MRPRCCAISVGRRGETEPACGEFYERQVDQEIDLRMKNLESVPMINLSMGGRYCSMTTVDIGNALVFERKMVRTATARYGD
jgi:hypothetical protein